MLETIVPKTLKRRVGYETVDKNAKARTDIITSMEL